MTEAATQVPANQTTTRKSRNNLALILIVVAIIAVAAIAGYYIYYGFATNYIWYVSHYSEKTSDTFSDTNFHILRTKSDIDKILTPSSTGEIDSVYYDTTVDNMYSVRDNIENHDYLVVAFTHDSCSSYSVRSGKYYIKNIKDGTATIAHDESAFSYRTDVCEMQEYYLIIESKKKGDFDQIQRVEGLDYDRNAVRHSTPYVPASYLYKGHRIGIQFGGRKSYLNGDPVIISKLEDAEEYLYDEEMAEQYDKEEAYLRTIFTKEMLEADFETYDYILVNAEMDYCGGSITNVGVTKINAAGLANVVIEGESSCGPCPSEFHYYLIPVSKGSVKTVVTGYNFKNDDYCDPDVAYKPVIYLYPERETNISVKLGATEKLLVSYPTYIDGWHVKAQPNGNLTDLDTGRGLYSLYYEAENTVSGMHDEGFVFEGKDTVAFLEEKLAQLGLTDREAEEFIVYWLPKMQDSPYNYVYFETTDEVAANMPLDVAPVPDTIIRINMEWKALDAPIKVKQQNLPATPIREGFTPVEWGGTIL